MKTYCVTVTRSGWETANIKANSKQEAERIAEKSLEGERDDVEWTAKGGDATVTSVEELAHN